MEAFNQVMMDELLDLGFQLGEPPVLVETVPNTQMLALEGTQRATLRWRRLTLKPGGHDSLQAEHDYALDFRDLGEDLPDHTSWSRDILIDLLRALEAGNYNAPPSELVQGAGTLVQDLDRVMELVTFQPEQLRRP